MIERAIASVITIAVLAGACWLAAVIWNLINPIEEKEDAACPVDTE